MGYESRLVVGEVYSSLSSSPTPMFMMPIATLSLSKMGIGEFAKLRGDAKYAGVSIARITHIEARHRQALALASDFIKEHAPEGSFARNVEWWDSLQDIAKTGSIETQEHADAYGEPFKRLPIRQTATIMRDIAAESGYRRAVLAADTLDHFVRGLDTGAWEEYDPSRDGLEPRSKIMLIHEGY